tara:strand:+ start:606 stop:2702 length:2097 start_codon:yes stop_codon:yes gene_type:complete
MAEVYIDGLGDVQLEGNTPNAAEKEAIINALKKQETPEPQTEEQKTQSFTESALNAFKSRDTSLAAGGMAGFASGARLGAMGGGAVAGIPGAIVGGIGGGVLGAAGAGQAYDILESFIKGENLGLDDTAKQAFKDIKRESMFSLGAASIPGLKPMVTRLLSKRGKGELVSKEVKQLYDAGKRIGVNVLPLDTSGKLGKAYTKVVGVFPIVGSPIRRAAETRGRQISTVKNEVLNDLAPNASLSELGVDMFNAAKNTNQEFRNVASSLYNVFYKQSAKINKPFIPSEGIRKESQKAIDDFLKNRPVSVTTKIVKGKSTPLIKSVDKSSLKGLRNKQFKLQVKKPIGANINKAYEQYIKGLSNLEDFITPAQVKQIKKDLAEFSKGISGKDGGGVFKLSQIAKSTELSLRDFSKYNLAAFGTNPNVSRKSLENLVNELKNADKFYANGIKVFQRSTAQQFTKADKNIFIKGFDKPGSIESDELFKYVIKAGSPSAIKDLRYLIGSENFAKVSRKVIDNAFTKASVRGDNLKGLVFNPDVLEEQLGLIGRNQSDILENITKGTTLNKQKLKDLILVSKYHSQMEIPDVSSFIQRRAMLGGVKAVAGGALMGAGVVASPIVSPILIYMTKKSSKFFASPKNVGLAIEALDITAPRSIRYIAGDKLLRGLIKDSEGEEKELYQQFQNIYKKDKNNIINNTVQD